MANGDPAPKDVQQHVRELVARSSVVKVANDLGIGREAVSRIVAGHGVRAGTIELVRTKMNFTDRKGGT